MLEVMMMVYGPDSTVKAKDYVSPVNTYVCMNTTLNTSNKTPTKKRKKNNPIFSIAKD
jgi:hypothetical protein